MGTVTLRYPTDGQHKTGGQYDGVTRKARQRRGSGGKVGKKRDSGQQGHRLREDETVQAAKRPTWTTKDTVGTTGAKETKGEEGHRRQGQARSRRANEEKDTEQTIAPACESMQGNNEGNRLDDREASAKQGNSWNGRQSVANNAKRMPVASMPSIEHVMPTLVKIREKIREVKIRET
ncbi:hypothetical protein JB92DRAFT_2830889 [Gautieria morchelliformis]|nr:hypothetical protein JB92DRAFT_2830889 [Gautieria morchelliformis]